MGANNVPFERSRIDRARTTVAKRESAMGTRSAVSAVSSGCALLVCNDPPTIGQLTRVMQQFAIVSEVCTDVPAALQLLNGRKFEAVIVDLRLGEQTRELLERVRISPANRTAVTFAIADETTPAAKPEAQTNFVLVRPLTEESVSKTVRAAYGLIVRERRRYFRCPVTVPADVRENDTEQIHCQTMNVSEGGLALSTSVQFKLRALVGIQFTLPGQSSEIDAESEICWYDGRTRAGLQFRALPSRQQSLLHAWLAQRLEETLPESVARKFRKTED